MSSHKITLPISSKLFWAMGNQNLTISRAIAEFIDNSIDARLDSTSVTVQLFEDHIIVTDNSSGMDIPALTKALTPAESSKTSGSTVGGYGFGLKTASAFLGNCLEIITTTKDMGSALYVKLENEKEDVKSIQLEYSSIWEVQALEVSKTFPQGTTIKVSKLNRPRYKNDIENATAHFSKTFSIFLQTMELELVVDDKIVTPYIFDPYWKKEFSFSVQNMNGKECGVSGWVGVSKSPEHSTTSKTDNGFHLYLNGRLLNYGIWIGLDRHPEMRLLVGVINLQNFRSNVTKTEVLSDSQEYIMFEESFLEWLKQNSIRKLIDKNTKELIKSRKSNAGGTTGGTTRGTSGGMIGETIGGTTGGTTGGMIGKTIEGTTGGTTGVTTGGTTGVTTRGTTRVTTGGTTGGTTRGTIRGTTGSAKKPKIIKKNGAEKGPIILNVNTYFNALDFADGFDYLGNKIPLLVTHKNSPLDAGTPGEYILSYTAKDQLQQSCMAEIKFTVVDPNSSTSTREGNNKYTVQIKSNQFSFSKSEYKKFNFPTGDLSKKIQDTIVELGNLDFNMNKIAVVALFRILIELCCRKACNFYTDISYKENALSTNINNVFNKLRNKLPADKATNVLLLNDTPLSDKLAKEFSNFMTFTDLDSAHSSMKKSGVIDLLNLYIHHERRVPDNVINYWDATKPFLVACLMLPSE
ncbi:ATP-binding protein [Paenibacillus yanchengensis]|uniref:ATP-binding protein n=1 Tax=Paenibacillus yanchengensis TaxID=2035833 RepID=A0ABW4YGL7_9BACL